MKSDPWISESQIEDATLEWRLGCGYTVANGAQIGPDSAAPERGSYDQVVLLDRFREALARLNPHLPAETLEEVVRNAQAVETPSLSPELVAPFEYHIAPRDDRIQRNVSGNRMLAQTRDLLLPKRMSGEISMRDAEKAVEAVA